MLHLLLSSTPPSLHCLHEYLPRLVLLREFALCLQKISWYMQMTAADDPSWNTIRQHERKTEASSVQAGSLGIAGGRLPAWHSQGCRTQSYRQTARIDDAVPPALM